MEEGANTASSPAHAASLPWAEGQIEPTPGGRRRDRRRQHAGNRVYPPIEAELAQHRVFGQVVGSEHAHRCQDSQCYRQIEMAAFLCEIGRRQVDGDALGRQCQANGDQGGSYPFPAFGDRLVGQSDHGEDGHPRRHLHLDVDLQAIDSLEGHGLDPCHH